MKRMVFLGLCLLGWSSLPAQSPAERRFLDSLLVRLDFATSTAMLPDSTVCAGHSGPMQNLCTALRIIRRNEVINRCESPCLVAEITERPDWATPRALLNPMAKSEKDWASVWYGLALIGAHTNQRDSTYRLFNRALDARGLPTGVVAIAAARFQFLHNRADDAWNNLLNAAHDTATAAQSGVKSFLQQFAPPNIAANYDSVALNKRESYLRKAPNLNRDIRAFMGRALARSNRITLPRYTLYPMGDHFLIAFAFVGELPNIALAPYPVRIQFNATRAEDGKTRTIEFNGTLRFTLDSTALRRTITFNSSPIIRANDLLVRGPVAMTLQTDARINPSLRLPAVVDLSLPPGHYKTTVALFLNNSKYASETVEELIQLVAPPLNSLGAGALVLGGDKVGVIWNSPTQKVSVNPFREYPQDAVVSMYAPLRGLTPGSQYRTTLGYFPIDEKTNLVADNPTITMTYQSNAAAREGEWYKELDVKQVKSGKYQVRLTIESEGQVATTSDVIWIRGKP